MDRPEDELHPAERNSQREGRAPPPRPLRLGQRVPSGPRPKSSTPRGVSFAETSKKSSSSVPVSASPDEERILGQGVDLTSSPEQSPPATDSPTSIFSRLPPHLEKARYDQNIRSLDHHDASKSPAPSVPVPSPRHFSPPLTTSKVKPTALRLNTSDLAPPRAHSPTKGVSPSLKHWQQIRHHVLATPVEERAKEQEKEKRKSGLVYKTVGRLGLKQAAENVLGLDDRRRSMAVYMDTLGGLSNEQKEEIARERRRFARDIRVCLDACAQEETKRRLARSAASKRISRDGKTTTTPMSAGTGSTFAAQPEFSAYAPLLMELHKFLPAARARQIWSRTCPHHGAILAELGMAFLPDSLTTDGERQQALEVFGAVVRNWAAEGPDDELMRWIWLCNALRCGDRQVRARGLNLLSAFLHNDPTLPRPSEQPSSAQAFVSLAVALIRLLQGIESSSYDTANEHRIVMDLISDLAEGEIISVDHASLESLTGYECISSVGGTTRELLWLAAGEVLGSDASMAVWLLRPDNGVLIRFAPHPILHAVSPTLLHIRQTASTAFLSASQRILASLPTGGVARVWTTIQDLVIPQLSLLPNQDALSAVRAEWLIAMLLHTTGDSDVLTAVHQMARGEIMELWSETGRSGDTIRSSWEAACQEERVELVISTLGLALREPVANAFATAGVEALFDRSDLASASESLRIFLTRLSRSHPQKFYKPLFSLAACADSVNLVTRLRKVQAITNVVGSHAFWMDADPQMISIVICGAGPSPVAQKGDDGAAKHDIRPGRYAVLVQLLQALAELNAPVERGSGMRGFLDKVESRIGGAVMDQVAKGTFPSTYIGLLAMLFFRIRSLTRSSRRSAWMSMVLKWFTPQNRNPVDGDIVMGDLEAAYSLAESATSIPARPGTSRQRSSTMLSLQTPASKAFPTSHPLSLVFHTNSRLLLARLIVLLQTCWNVEEWQAFLPIAWRSFGEQSADVEIDFLYLFCIAKSSEMIASNVHETISTDLRSTSSAVRLDAIRKLGLIYGYRYQVCVADIISDRRGPMLHFAMDNFPFAPTEIGSINWVPPTEMQDAALKQFGKTLPLDVRQRLLELGWSDDPSLNADDDRAKIPISSLPLAFLNEVVPERKRTGAVAKPTTSPVDVKPALRRNASTSSNGSGVSITRGRRAIFPPTMLDLVSDASMRLLAGADGVLQVSTIELSKLVQREDASILIRTFSDRVEDDFLGALARLNGMIGSGPSSCTPAFAYVALNAIVGFLKQAMRKDPSFSHTAMALVTVARLVPIAPDMSLRNVRKNKAEHILLPGSIHEDEAGFKLYAPWREGDVSIQTAQLVVLQRFLKANPRDVYLVKRLLAQVPVEPSLTSVYFTRAWLMVNLDLFGMVHRTYNDRSELRRFLSIAALALRRHIDDVPIASYAVQLFMLCSARYRRLFAVIGCETCAAAIFDAYVKGSAAVRDCIEYAFRAFYRIHSDSVVYQFCDTVVAADLSLDAPALYDLISALALPNTPRSGMASGIKGQNDREELEALAQMLSGPEIAISEIGKDRAERQVAKLASIASDKNLFPVENIVKLFVTVIAANPPARRSIAFLDVFGRMISSITDELSRGLVRDAIAALGGLILSKKVDVEAASAAFAQDSESEPDWTGAKLAYIRFVDSFLRDGGVISSAGTKIALDVITELLRPSSMTPEIAVHASASLTSLTASHLSPDSGLIKSQVLLQLAPIFDAFVSVVDFSGVLSEIRSFIARSKAEMVESTALVIQERFVSRAIRYVAETSASVNTTAATPAQAVSDLLCRAVNVKGNPFRALDAVVPSPRLLVGLIFPFVLSVRARAVDDTTGEFGNAHWIRLLNWVIQATNSRAKDPPHASTIIFTVQAIKVIIVRGADYISAVPGLWSYLARYLMDVAQWSHHTQASAMSANAPAAKLRDWIMWTTFELVALYRSPLLIPLRPSIAVVVSAANGQIRQQASPVGSPVLSPATVADSPSHRMRRYSGLRTPSSGSAGKLGTASPELGGSPTSNRLSPTRLRASPSLSPMEGKDSARRPSFNLRSSSARFMPILGHARRPSTEGRPSFADLSARRPTGLLSRQTDDDGLNPLQGVSVGRLVAPGIRNRFPSSAPIRNLDFGMGAITGEEAANAKRKGGAIVHLLGAPTQMMAAPGAPPMRRKAGAQRQMPHEHRLSSEEVQKRIRLARRRVVEVFGQGGTMSDGDGDEDVGGDEVDDADGRTRQWSALDALDEIAEQTRLLVEFEFKDLFVTHVDSSGVDREQGGGEGLSEKEEVSVSKGYSLDEIRPHEPRSRGSEELREKVPFLTVSSP